ncbi:unnamed protein product, partial [Meganyctiphanes norvegica]
MPRNESNSNSSKGEDRLRVAVLGSGQVGKSALTVRYLTKRFIGEYRSDSDMLYKCTLQIDGSSQLVEIMDTCNCNDSDDFGATEQQVNWGEAFIVVYSVTDKKSFRWAQDTVQELSLRQPHSPVMILGNKSDLHHLREVEEVEARTLALTYGARFKEISTAECCEDVTKAMDGFLKEVKATHMSVGSGNGSGKPGSPRLRKLSVSRMLTQLIGRHSPPPHPITEMIILDNQDRVKLSRQVL